MRQVLVPISKRARRFGYLFWPRRMEADIRSLLGAADEIGVEYCGNKQGTKKIDWKYARISIGQRQTRAIPEDERFFVLSRPDPGVLSISLAKHE